MNTQKQRTNTLTTLGLVWLMSSVSAHAELNGHPSSAQQCQQASSEEIAALFDRWNTALQSGNPDKVVERYAEHSILLPTVSGKARLTASEKKDYFVHFMAKNPVGKIEHRQIQVGCNSAVDSGHYTFTLNDGSTAQAVPARYSYAYQWNGDDWYIISHHSSMVPHDPH